MSKLQRKEADLHLPKHEEKMKEGMEHPRKTPEGQVDSSQTPSTEEGKPSHTGSRHPQAHRVKKIEDVFNSCRKSKFLPYCDSVNTCDVYFQPRAIIEFGKKWVTVQMEELIFGSKIRRDIHDYTLLACDLLRMIYLAEKADCVYYNMDIEEFDLWKVHRFSELMEENRMLDMSDDGAIADLLLKKKEFPFCLGRGSHLELYFQYHFVHDYEGGEAVENINSNLIICQATGRGKFEYCIDARIIMTSDEIHERKIGEMFEESQAI